MYLHFFNCLLNQWASPGEFLNVALWAESHRRGCLYSARPGISIQVARNKDELLYLVVFDTSSPYLVAAGAQCNVRGDYFSKCQYYL